MATLRHGTETRGTKLMRYRGYAEHILRAKSSTSVSPVIRLRPCPRHPDDDIKDTSDIEDMSHVGNGGAGHDGSPQLATTFRASITRAQQPYSPATNWISPTVVESIPYSHLKYILPNSKVLTYGLGFF